MHSIALAFQWFQKIDQKVFGTIFSWPLCTWHPVYHIQWMENSYTFRLLWQFCPNVIVHKSRMLIPRRSFTDWYEFGSHWFPHALSLVLGIILRPDDHLLLTDTLLEIFFQFDLKMGKAPATNTKYNSAWCNSLSFWKWIYKSKWFIYKSSNFTVNIDCIILMNW